MDILYKETHFFTVVAVKNDEIIAIGRLLGDATIYWFITDLFVLTEHQGKEGFYEKFGFRCRPHEYRERFIDTYGGDKIDGDVDSSLTSPWQMSVFLVISSNPLYNLRHSKYLTFCSYTRISEGTNHDQRGANRTKFYRYTYSA